jgi:hypothetical protein
MTSNDPNEQPGIWEVKSGAQGVTLEGINYGDL